MSRVESDGQFPQKAIAEPWPTAAKVATVAAVIFIVIGTVFLSLHYTHTLDLKKFNTLRVPDFFKKHPDILLKYWESIAFAGELVAATAGVVTLSAAFIWLIQSLLSPSKKQSEPPPPPPPARAPIPAAPVARAAPADNVPAAAPPPPAPAPAAQPPLLRPTAKQLGFALLDSSLKESGFEGGDMVDNVECILPYLRTKREIVAPVLPLLEELCERERNHPLTVEASVQSLNAATHFIDSYSQELADKTRDLPIHGRFLMRGGWNNKGKGHALLYIIERVSEHEYACTVVNTGAGLSYHESVLEGHEKRYRPIYRLHQISRDSLANSSFFRSLLELRIPYNEEGHSFSHGASDVYERILPSLGGVRDRVYENQISLISAQESGTCSWKVLMKLLQIEIADDPRYKAISFDLKREMLKGAFFAPPHTFKEQQLLALSATQFAQYALKQYDQGFITEQELTEARQLVSNIRTWKMAVERERAEAGEVIDLTQDRPARGELIPLSTLALSVPPPSDATPIATDALAPLLFSNRALPKTVEEMNLLLKEVQTKCNTYLEAGNPRGAIRTIKEFVKFLPPGSLAENGYLAKLCHQQPEASIEETMQLYGNLSHTLFAAIGALPEQQRGLPEEQALMYSLIATNLRLSHLLGQEWGLLFPYYLPTNWREDPFFTLYDGKVQSVFAESMDFLVKMKNNQLVGHFFFDKDSNHPSPRFALWNTVFNKYIRPKFPDAKEKSDYDLLLEIAPDFQKTFPIPVRTLLQQKFLIECLHNDPLFTKVRPGPLQATLGRTGSKSVLHLQFLHGPRNVYDNTSSSKFNDHTPFSNNGLFAVLKWAGEIPNNKPSWSEKPYEARLAQAIEGISLQESHTLKVILSKKETCIISLLAHLEEHPEKLANRDFQLLIHHLFYSGQILKMNLDAFPELSQKLQHFLLAQRELYRASGELQTELFLIDLITHVNRYVNDPEVDARALLKETIRRIDTTTSQGKQLKALAYTQLIIGYYDEPIGDDEAIDIISAYLYVKSFDYDRRLSHPYIEERMADIVNRIRHSELLKKELVQRDIVEKVAAEVLGMQNKAWQLSDPLCFSFQNYQINLNQLLILENGTVLSGIPEALKDYHFFQILFSQKDFTLRTRGEMSFLLKEKEGRDYRIFKPAGSPFWVIQREEKDGRWSTFSTSGPNVVPNALFEGHEHWLQVDDPTHGTVLIEKEGHVVAKVSANIAPNGFVPLTCTNQEGATLQMAPSPRLAAFQAEGFFLNWGNRRLDYPKAGFSFTVEDHGEGEKAYFSVNNRFYLSPVQRAPLTLPGSLGSLLLEDQEGEKLFLFPREPIRIASGGGAIVEEIAPDHTMRDGRYFQVREDNGHLTGKTVEENLFLAYLHLANKNYAEAQRLLATHYAQNPKGYNAQEKEILAWLFEMIDKNPNPSPSACAIELQLLHLCQQGSAPEFTTEKRLVSKLSRYYRTRHKAATVALSPTQEIELLQLLGNSRSKVAGAEERYRYLTNFAAQELILPQKLLENRKISPPHAQGKIDLIALEEELIRRRQEGLSKVGEKKVSKETFTLYGEERLLRYLDAFMRNCLSEDPVLRASMLSDLLRLRIKDKSILIVRNRLYWVGVHATPDQRRYFLARFPGKRDPLEKITLLNELNVEYPNVPAPQEADQPPPIEQVVERRQPERAPNFAPTEEAVLPLTVLQTLEVHGVHPERIAVEPLEMAEAAVAPPDQGRVITREFTRVQKSLEGYVAAEQKKEHLAFSDAELSQMKEIVDFRCRTMESQSRDLEKEILDLANKAPEEPADELVYAMEHLGGHRKPLTIDDLIIIYLQDNGKELAKRNPHLTQEEIHYLANQLQTYLLYSTEANYLSRLSSKIDEALTAEEADKAESLHQVEIVLKEERAYKDPRTYKALLIFEHYSGFRIRKDQVDLIMQFLQTDNPKERNIIAQLIMASGKSKLILPLLALLKSRGDNVVMIIVPDLLYETNLEDMRVLWGKYFKKPSYTIELEENQQLSIAKIEEILQTIEKAKRDHSYFLVQEATARALHLHFKDALVALEQYPGDIPPEAWERVDKLRTLINTLFDEVIIDEADMVLDHTKEMNFSKGGWHSISQPEQVLMESLWIDMARDDELREFFMLEGESDRPFNNEQYLESIKPKLADLILNKTEFTEEERKELRLYLLANPRIKKVPDCLQNADPDVKNQLALGKECLNRLFPFALGRERGKNVNQHFGLSRVANTFRAIPYDEQNKAPKEGSDFVSPFETMVYTTLYYARKGVAIEQLRTLVEEYRAEARMQSKAENLPLDQTEAYETFAAWELTDKDLFSIQESDLEKAIVAFNEDLEKRIAFSRKLGWREVGYYDRQLTCGATHLAGLFRIVQGFTGTLGNAESLPAGLIPKPDETTDGKSVQILTASNPEIVTTTVDNLYEKLRGYHACIDTGAWFRGMPALEVAQKMLAALDPDEIDGIVYFNDLDDPPGSQGLAVYLPRGAIKPKAFVVGDVPADKRFTYYNKTTGADIPQDPKAKALTTVGASMLLRDLLQGIWRMRELDKRQKTDLALSPELDQALQGGTLQKILSLAILNQAKRQSADNLGALKKKITYQTEAVILKALRDSSLSPQETRAIVHSALPLLATAVSMNSFDLFGEVEEEVDVVQVIARHIDKTWRLITKIYQEHSGLENISSLQQLQKSIGELIKPATLPEKAMESRAYGNSVEVQAKQEVRQEVSQELETVNALVSPIQNLPTFSTELPSLWYDEILDDRYRASFESWQGTTVQSLVEEHANELEELNPLDIFADELRITSQAAPHYKNILFQSGTLPVSLCALQIFPDNSMELVLLDPNESFYLSKLLDEYQAFQEGEEPIDESDPKFTFQKYQKLGISRAYNLVLVDPHVGIVKQGIPPIDEEELLQNPQYNRLSAQAKFFNGDLNSYSKAEEEALHTWIAEKGVERMRKLLAYILRARPDDRERLAHSQLGRILRSS